MKIENNISEGWRADLPDSAFGLPEDRKFPLDTEKRVRSAIKLFGHCSEEKKPKLAKKIARIAKKYNIEIPETSQVYKYLHEDKIEESPVGAMASVNPIVNSASRHYILQMTDGLSSDNLAYVNDPSSDKGLMVNEWGKLEVVDISSYDIINIYEFVGDDSSIRKLSKDYNSKDIMVESLYYELTGKHLYSEDQLDYDNNFMKIDVDFINECNLTDLITFTEEMNSTMNGVDNSLESLKSLSNNLLSLQEQHEDIVLKEDVNGYFLYSSLSNKRTRSVKEIANITENMFNSLLVN